MAIAALGYCFLLLAVSFIGVIRYKRLTPAFKVLTLSVITLLMVSILSDYLSHKYRNNAPALQIECIDEYVFYAVVYYYLFKNQVIKDAIIVSIIIISIYFIVNAIFFQPFLKVFPTNINLPAQILFTMFSLLLFKEMLSYPLNVNIVRQSIFWFNTAMLLYATTMFFALGLSNYLAQRPFEDKIISNFWYFIDYLFHIFIGISLLTDNKENNAARA